MRRVQFLPLFLSALCSSAALAQTFQNPRLVATPTDPYSVVAGDINHDGRPDLIYGTGVAGGGVLHPLLAQADGSYTPGTDIALPSNITSRCQLADLTGDGNPDLVCASDGASVSVAVLPGNADGTFQAAIVSPSAPASSSTHLIVAIGDLNHDGHPDVIASTNSGPLTPFLNDGTGHLTPVASLSDSGGYLAALRDLNGDGNLDVVASSSSGTDTLVFFGKGDGTFGTATRVSNIVPNVLCDMNRDGRPDLVGGSSGTLSVLEGNADGSFGNLPIAVVNYNNIAGTNNGNAIFQGALACQDLNGDSYPDLLARGNDGMTVLLGQPGITFAAPAHYPVGIDLSLSPSVTPFTQPPPVFADLDGDGNLDVVAAGFGGLYISYGTRDGGFHSASVYETGNLLAFATVADFNGDHIPDVVSGGNAQLVLSSGIGDGAFNAPRTIANANLQLTASGNARLLHADVDGDGNEDIIVVNYPDRTSGLDTLILRGHGDGTFDAPLLLFNRATLSNSDAVQIADINKDGRPDFLFSDGTTLTLYLSVPSGPYTSASYTLPTAGSESNSSFFSVADVDNDGNLDVVYSSTGHVFVLAGRGNGTFASAGSYAVPAISGAVAQLSTATAVGDFDGDHLPDIAVLVRFSRSSGDLQSSQLFTLYGTGTSLAGGAAFTSAVSGPAGSHAYSTIQAADLDRDGRSDVVLDNRGYTNPPGNVVASLLGQSNRTFAPEADFTAGIGLFPVLLADLNGDSRPDIVAANGDASRLANSFTVLLNQQGPQVKETLVASPEPSAIGQPFTLNLSITSGNSPVNATGQADFYVGSTFIGSANINGGLASITAPSNFPAGVYTILAETSYTVGGVASGLRSVRSTHVINGVAAVVTISGSATSVALGTTINFTETLSNADPNATTPPYPTGNTTISDNGVNFALSVAPPPGTPNGGYSFSRTFNTGGAHIITANYLGDSTHSAASASITVQVTATSSSTALTSSVNPSAVSQPVTFTATVTATTGTAIADLLASSSVAFTFPAPVGTVTVPVTFSPSGTSNTVTGTASFTTSGLLAGSWPITAVFSGNSSVAGSTSPTLTQVVRAAGVPGPTSTALSAGPNPAYLGQVVTLVAAVTGANPSGAVQFFDGASAIGTSVVTNGRATLLTSTLALGSHSLTAVYNGDVGNLTSTSGAVTEVILNPAFTLSLQPASISLHSGAIATTLVKVASQGSFGGTIKLTAGNPPAHSTMSFSSASLGLTAGGSATSTLTIDTTPKRSANQTASVLPPRFPGRAIPAIAAGALLLLPLGWIGRRRLPTLLTVLLAATLLLSTTGCGLLFYQLDVVAPGTYIVPVTATDTQTGVSQTANLTVVVTQ